MHLNWSCVPRASQHHTVLSFCSIRNRFPRTAQVQRYRKNNPAIPHNPTSSNLHISERPFFLLLHVVKSTPLCQTLFSSWAEVILWYFWADLTSTICYNLVRAKWPHHLPGFEFSELSKDQVRALRKKWEFFSSRVPRWDSESRFFFTSEVVRLVCNQTHQSLYLSKMVGSSLPTMVGSVPFPFLVLVNLKNRFCFR